MTGPFIFSSKWIRENNKYYYGKKKPILVMMETGVKGAKALFDLAIDNNIAKLTSSLYFSRELNMLLYENK